MMALQKRTYLSHYMIYDVVYEDDKELVYLAEDFQYNQVVLLHEFLPSRYATRVSFEGEDYHVESMTGYKEQFDLAKARFKSVSEKLLHFQHDVLIPVLGLFENNGTLYRVTEVPNKEPLNYYLTLEGFSFDEGHVTQIALSLLELLSALKSQQLALRMQPHDLFLEEGTLKAVVNPTVEIIEYDDDLLPVMLHDFGALIYLLMSGSEYRDGDTIETSARYSNKLISLVNNILTAELDQRPKTLENIKAVLQPETAERGNYGLASTSKKRLHNTPSRYARLIVWGMVLILSGVVLWNNQNTQKIDNSPNNEQLALRETSVMYDHIIAAVEGRRQSQKVLKNRYGIEYVDEAALRRTYEWFYEQASKGDAYAQYRLGYIYSRGYGVEKNFDQAVVWLKRSLKNGYLLAYYALGYVYDHAEGPNKNYQKAYEWYYEGAKKHEVNCEYAVAYMLDVGLGVKEDREASFTWKMIAAKKGYAKAQYGLAVSYEVGKGTSVDLERARHWYTKAAAQGIESAKRKLKSWEQGGIYTR